MILNLYLLATTKACNSYASTNNYIETNDQFINKSNKTKMITFFNFYNNNNNSLTANKKERHSEQ